LKLNKFVFFFVSKFTFGRHILNANNWRHWYRQLATPIIIDSLWRVKPSDANCVSAQDTQIGVAKETIAYKFIGFKN